MFVCRTCVSRRLFTVKTLLFPEIYVTLRQTHNELVLSPPMDPRLVSAPYIDRLLKTESGRCMRICLFFSTGDLNNAKRFEYVC